MAHRNSDSMPVSDSEKSASLRSTASRHTDDNDCDTDSTASVDSDIQEFRNSVNSKDTFRVMGGEIIMAVGESKATGSSVVCCCDCYYYILNCLLTIIIIIIIVLLLLLLLLLLT